MEQCQRMGKVIVTWNEIDFLDSLALMVRVLEAKDVVRVEGLPGRVPSS